MRNRYPYDIEPRFVQPSSSGDIINPYDIDSRLLQDLEQRQIEPVLVFNLNLTVVNTGLVIPAAGYHFCLFGNDGSSIKTINTTAFVNAWINTKAKNNSNPFPLKHARGYSGPFSGLYLEWPAQAGVYADLVIYKGANKPWIDGESGT